MNQYIVQPQVVAFELPADGSTQTIEAFFGTDPTTLCKQTITVVLPPACASTTCVAGQTGGTVFYDNNADSIRDAGELTGLAGVTVKAYTSAGAGVPIATATTDAFGKYVFPTIAPTAFHLRVEFTNVGVQGTLNGAKPTGITAVSTDPDAYTAVGKVGIGGLDLSSDGNKLYFTNLFDNRLYEIDITAYNASGTLPTTANVKSFDMRVSPAWEASCIPGE